MFIKLEYSVVRTQYNNDDHVYEPDYGSTVRGKDMELLDSE